MADLFVFPPSPIELPSTKELCKAARDFHMVTDELATFKDKVLRFVNRSLYPQLILNSKPDDPYELQVVSGFKNLLSAVFLTTSHEKKKLSGFLAEVLEKVFVEELEIVDPCWPLVVGLGTPGADETLYAAWEIMTSVRQDIYLVFARTARCNLSFLWLLEGNVKAFLSPENIGWHGSGRKKNVDPEKFLLEEIKSTDGSREVVRIRTAITPGDFVNLFQMALVEGLLSAEG